MLLGFGGAVVGPDPSPSCLKTCVVHIACNAHATYDHQRLPMQMHTKIFNPPSAAAAPMMAPPTMQPVPGSTAPGPARPMGTIGGLCRPVYGG